MLLLDDAPLQNEMRPTMLLASSGTNGLDQADAAMEELKKLQSGQLVRGRSGHLAQLQCVTIST